MTYCTDAFFDAYIECALWSSTDRSRDDGGDPLDDNYGPDDIAPESLAAMRSECEAFCEANNTLLCLAGDDAQNGHDFWLTRNRHGAGFWDRGYGDIGDQLTKACKLYGSCDLCIGDDGKVYAL